MQNADEVSQIISSWQLARPDLDFSPLAIFSRLWRITRHLERARAAAFEQAGLASWEFDVLAVLRRSGEPYRESAKVLVQQTMVSSGTMTNRIDRMSERGLVRRSADPNDGRSVRIEMTQAGLRLVDSAIARLTAAEHELLTGLSEEEREMLAKLLSKLSGLLGQAENSES